MMTATTAVRTRSGNNRVVLYVINATCIIITWNCIVYITIPFYMCFLIFVLYNVAITIGLTKNH